MSQCYRLDFLIPLLLSDFKIFHEQTSPGIQDSMTNPSSIFLKTKLPSKTFLSCGHFEVFEHCSFTSRKLRLLLCIHLRVESSTTAKFIHLERGVKKNRCYWSGGAPCILGGPIFYIGSEYDSWSKHNISEFPRQVAWLFYNMVQYCSLSKARSDFGTGQSGR